MHITQRSLTIVRGLLKRYGPSKTKKLLWDDEFSRGHWDFIDNTVGDCVYPCLERYAAHGSILDLGCGPGNTANEVAATAYRNYVGVDISEVALRKAKARTKETGREENNRFECGDFLSYAPSQQFDVILFRESMYHVPLASVKGMLGHYSNYLTENGVFIVRMVTANKDRLNAMIDIIIADFDVAERHQYGDPGATVVVFRPRR